MKKTRIKTQNKNQLTASSTPKAYAAVGLYGSRSASDVSSLRAGFTVLYAVSLLFLFRVCLWTFPQLCYQFLPQLCLCKIFH